MAYQLVPDILAAIILAATFLLCLRSFRREDHRHAESLCDAGVASSSHDAGVSKQSLAELLNLMDASVGRPVRVGDSPVMGAAEAGATRISGVEDRLGAGVFTRQSSESPLNVMDEIEVTVRVNTQRTSAAARPVGSQDIVNAEWEPVYPEITRARRVASSRAAGR
jgi:hypothetical protein